MVVVTVKNGTVITSKFYRMGTARKHADKLNGKAGDIKYAVASPLR
jgi:hypothetical protein